MGEGMFFGAEAFNQDLSKWDVSKVTDMASMFFGADDFNQDLSKWDVSKVTNMRGMFYDAKAFNKCLLPWVSRSPALNGRSVVKDILGVSIEETVCSENDA